MPDALRPAFPVPAPRPSALALLAASGAALAAPAPVTPVGAAPAASPEAGAVVAALAAALVLALAHAFGSRLAFVRGSVPRPAALSAAGGVSVAYVLLQLLPEVSEAQGAIEEALGAWWPGLALVERHVWILALVGLVAIYGLERAARSSSRGVPRAAEGGTPSHRVYRIHLVTYAVYGLLIGALLVERAEAGTLALALYTVALALHLLVSDHGLQELFEERYRRRGRWWLAATPPAGVLLALALGLPEAALGMVLAFLAGGMILNVMKEELPEERESRFGAFAAGAAGYGALLLLL